MESFWNFLFMQQEAVAADRREAQQRQHRPVTEEEVHHQPPPRPVTADYPESAVAPPQAKKRRTTEEEIIQPQQQSQQQQAYNMPKILPMIVSSNPTVGNQTTTGSSSLQLQQPVMQQQQHVQQQRIIPQPNNIVLMMGNTTTNATHVTTTQQIMPWSTTVQTAPYNVPNNRQLQQQQTIIQPAEPIVVVSASMVGNNDVTATATNIATATNATTTTQLPTSSSTSWTNNTVPNPYMHNSAASAATATTIAPPPAAPPLQQIQQTKNPLFMSSGAVAEVPVPVPVPAYASVSFPSTSSGAVGQVLAEPMPMKSSRSSAAVDDNTTQQSSSSEKKRKQRNVETARRARARKKNQEAVLKLELLSLQRENEHLRNIVKKELPEDKAQQVIGECCYNNEQPTSGATGSILHGGTHGSSTPGTGIAVYKKMGRSDFEMIEELTKSKKSFCLTDPRLPDNPIVYASPAFIELTGYPRGQVVGRNCRFLQGPDTDPNSVKEIRDAIAAGKDGATCLLNYKPDGTPYWNEFFVAPLRDRENRIVNYVGVQTQVSKKDESVLVPKPDSNAAGLVSSRAEWTEEENLTEKLARMRREYQQQQLQNKNSEGEGAANIVDWSELAEMFEADNNTNFDDPLVGSVGIMSNESYSQQELEDILLDQSTTDSWLAAANDDDALSVPPPEDAKLEKVYFDYFTKSPRDLVTMTLRSELIDSLTSCSGDTSDPRFVSALELLTKIFKNISPTRDIARTDIMHGQWKAISHPPYHYGGRVGTNETGETVYTLGKMCFNMFKPSNLRVTVQNTMNSIEPVCRFDQAPTAVPWSLRRELALLMQQQQQQGDDSDDFSDLNTTLKSYDIAAALTIEPGQFNNTSSPAAAAAAAAGETVSPQQPPPRRLRASHVVKGFFLPDPDTPNRMTVWFTGGYLSPVLPQRDGSSTKQDLSHDGTLDDWVELFGAEHKRTWGEAFGVLGAKLLLGADLPDGMKSNGTMSYTLHRPFGGHGRGYVDILYADHELLITKGQSGTIHAMIRSAKE